MTTGLIHFLPPPLSKYLDPRLYDATIVMVCRLFHRNGSVLCEMEVSVQSMSRDSSRARDLVLRVIQDDIDSGQSILSSYVGAPVRLPMRPHGLYLLNYFLLIYLLVII